MAELERFNFFAQVIKEICMYSLIASGKSLRWLIIANPSAGGFTMRPRWKKNLNALEEIRQAAQKNPLRKDCVPSGISENGLILTNGKGHAAEIAGAMIKEAESNKEPFYLFICAGGDGTSLEVSSVIFKANAEIRSRLAILRLPMGTGNDGSDSPDLKEALDLLIKPTKINFKPALQLRTNPGGTASKYGRFLAFNILSAGIDAFITHMTNKMKGKLPGDFYKLWVDIASLLYDSLYKVDFIDVKAFDGQGREVIVFREKLLLIAMGISGHRTYGSQKKILPDERNVCALCQMPLFRKLTIKGLFSKGTHIHKPESILFNAERLEFKGMHPMLVQMDGETVLLMPEDFPAVIELTEPVIPVLEII